jgi:hypothetical protein
MRPLIFQSFVRKKSDMFFEYRIKEGEEVQLHPPCARSGSASQPQPLPVPHATRCLARAHETNQIK